MSITVLVEPLPDGSGFRARTGDPLNLTATGPTRQDAMTRIHELVADRIEGGARVYTLPLPGPAGVRIPADAGRPRWTEADLLAWREGVEEYRREVDEEDRRRLGITEPYIPE